MITLSNGHELEYVVASGALAFDGKGWWWEKPLFWLGLIQPKLFTIFTKSLTLPPRKGYLRWWHPWTCVRLIIGGAVNKVGLTNKGFYWWMRKIAPKLDFANQAIAVNIFGNKEELVEMALGLNQLQIVAVEINVSCPNSGDQLEVVETVVSCVKTVKAVSHHPVIVKLSVDQNYLEIARQLSGIAEAVSLNSVPWSTVFPQKRSPLWRLERKVGGGGGGVSGEPAQDFNWRAGFFLAKQGSLPVIFPSVMKYCDIHTVRSFGAKAISFGTLFLRAPWKPNEFVRKDMKCRTQS